MKKNLKFLTILLCALVAAFAFVLGACDGDESGNEQKKPETGTIHGSVLDEDGEPIEGAEIYFNGEEDDYYESDEEGEFEIKNVPVGDVTLKAVYSGYTDASKSLTEADFDANGDANVKIVMQEGHGTVMGIVSMAGNTTNHLEGATVKIGSQVVKTDEDGHYEITNVRMLGTQMLTVSLAGFADNRANITARSFSNGVAHVNIQLVQNDLAELPGLKPYELETLNALDSEKTIYAANDIGSLFGRSPNGLGDGNSLVEEHGEGFCLNANTTTDNDNMVSFVYAKLKVTAANSYLTAYARIFYGQNNGDTRHEDGSWDRGTAKLAKLGLYAFDVTDINKPVFINDSRFGDFTEITTESLTAVTFDLTSMQGKTIVLVLGTKTGYHCCLGRIELSAEKPEYLHVTGVDGLTDLRKYDKVSGTSFDASALKDKWAIGGGTSTVEEGIQLNGTDPWKAVDFNSANPQPVNSYMYILTDLDEATPHMTVKATIVKLADTYDPGQENKQFLPYFCVIVLDESGNNVYQSVWTKLEVAEDKAEKVFDFDLTGHTGENMTVIIAANVGYRATITGVSFGATAADNATPVQAQPAMIPSKQED